MTGQLQTPTDVIQAIPQLGYKTLIIDVPLSAGSFTRNADDFIDVTSYFPTAVTSAIGYGIASGSTTAASLVEGEFFNNSFSSSPYSSTSLGKYVYMHTSTVSLLIVTGY